MLVMCREKFIVRDCGADDLPVCLELQIPITSAAFCLHFATTEYMQKKKEKDRMNSLVSDVTVVTP